MESRRKGKTREGHMEEGLILNTSSSDPQKITSILSIAASSQTAVGSDFKLKRHKVPHTYPCVYTEVRGTRTVDSWEWDL